MQAGKSSLGHVTVAVTRPNNQSKKLSKLIQGAGGKVIPFPLIKIVPLDDYSDFNRQIGTIKTIDWLLFISSNAVQCGMPLLLKNGIPDTVKFASIGPKTAEALGQFGVDNVLIPEGRFDSESLLSTPEMQNTNGKKVMIVRGVGGREVLANTLKSRGAHVSFAECYQRTNPQTNCDTLHKAYENQQLQSIIVTSSEAMRHLLDLAGDAHWLKHVSICVNHPRIAEQPECQGLRICVAEAPGDEAMMQLLIKANS